MNKVDEVVFEGEVLENKGKKRKRDSSKWRRNIKKNAKLKGLEYKDYKGQEKRALTVGENCRCKRLNCFEGISDDEAITIFKRVHDLETKNEQDLFIQSLIETCDVSRRRPRKESSSRKVQHSFKYFSMVGNKKREICYKAFLALHGITDKRVKRLRALAIDGKLPLDMRGKSASANTLHPDTREKIKTHIESFPTKMSRYSGKVKLFLDARLSVVSMHQMFQEKHPNVKCGVKFYRDYFNENFNLSFGRPQIDTCSTCEELEQKIKSPHLSENSKRAAQAELDVHKRKSKKFYNALTLEAQTKDQPQVLSLAMDYMQNVPLPQIPIQDTFYMRQLTVNLFCIHNIKENTCMIYLYHEGIANKGPNEVCSFLHDYLSTVSTQYTKLKLFSDNCGGQNKNHSLARFLLALTDTGRFKSIEQFFPVRGHSFLPCDRDFATIKRELKKHDRLYDIETLRNLVIKSSKVGKVTVKEVATAEILEFKQWWQTYYKKSVISEETKPKEVPKNKKIGFGISSLMHFKYTNEKPGTITCSQTIDSMLVHTFRLAQSQRLQPKLPDKVAYPNGKVPIKLAKVCDIKKLVPYVPAKYQDFYTEIVNWPTTAENVNDQDD